MKCCRRGAELKPWLVPEVVRGVSNTKRIEPPTPYSCGPTITYFYGLRTIYIYIYNQLVIAVMSLLLVGP